MENLETLRELLPFLIPVVILDLCLIAWALVDWARRPRTKGPKWVWLLVILFVSTFGPIIYLVFGREEAEDAGDSD